MCAINIFIICILGVVPGFTQEDQKLHADSLGARVDEAQGLATFESSYFWNGR